MYQFINSEGQTITTNTIKEFAQLAGLRESNARSLACGYVKTFKNWCSTHRRARRVREKFTTRLINTVTGEEAILGQYVTRFCRAHGLSTKNLYGLLNGKRLAYKGWTLERTLKLTGVALS